MLFKVVHIFTLSLFDNLYGINVRGGISCKEQVCINMLRWKQRIYWGFKSEQKPLTFCSNHLPRFILLLQIIIFDIKIPFYCDRSIFALVLISKYEIN